ncbi:MAG: RAMP superfamily CRISPR-associated protein [Candidatus Hadarchaeum sp.]|uniref:RAMP superfamily CRISPR-associated protein n=1 Tax=Candidatus Hadarchaeum sp. TaxID=2883567 RepID=UPI003D12966B
MIYTLFCSIACLEDVHVGSGMENETGHAMLPRSGEACVIPGSTLKGMVRCAVEYLHRNDPQEDYCFILVSRRPPNMRWLGRLQRRLGLHKLPKGPCREKICRICSLFGKPFHASKVFFSDAMPPPGFVPKVVRSRFGQMEVFPKGTELRFKIQTKDIDEEGLNLLLEGLRGLGSNWKHFLGLKKYDHLEKGGNVRLRVEKIDGLPDWSSRELREVAVPA